MNKVYKNIRKYLSKYLISGLLVLCVLAAFLPPAVNVSVAAVALVVLLSRIVVLNVRKVS